LGPAADAADDDDVFVVLAVLADVEDALRRGAGVGGQQVFLALGACDGVVLGLAITAVGTGGAGVGGGAASGEQDAGDEEERRETKHEKNSFCWNEDETPHRLDRKSVV